MKLAVFLAAVSAVASQEARVQDNSGGRAAGTSEAEFWDSYIHTMDSFPSAAPSPQPTPGIPVIPPTPGPTPPPTPAPIPGTAPPTAICELDVVLDCAYINPETGEVLPCEEIPPLDTKECMCPECVRELAFVYTGEMCSGDEVTCSDTPGPSGEAIVSFFACNSTTPAFTTTPIIPGTPIDLSLGGDICLPDCMDITVSNAAGQLLQAFQFDTECNGGNELLLKESYGALQFNGYTCDENDVNNCLLDVIFGVSACNLGTANMTLYEFALNFNGTMTDFLIDGSRPIVASGDCYDEVGEAFVDRCLESEYVATATANATNPLGGPLCEDSAEVTIVIPPPTPPMVQPTPSPVPPPTLAPVPPPTLAPSTPAPTPPLTPPPTGDCNIAVTVEPECPLIPCNFDRCLQRPFRMLFRVDPAPCSASVLKRCPGVDPDTCTCTRNVTLTDDEWAEQKFFCTDFNGGPQPTFNGTFWAVATPEKDEEVIYFSGPIELGVGPDGRRFNATAPAGTPTVEANMFLNLFTADPAMGGVLLQKVLFHSSCSQQLFLLDIFGSFQLIEFENEDQGVVGFGISPVVSFNINLDIQTDETGELILDFMSVVVLSGVPGLLPPQVIPIDVAGATIPFQTQEEVTLLPGQPMNVITTIGGTLDGIGCFDVTNTTIQCDATIDPNSGQNTAPTAAPRETKAGGARKRFLA